MSFSLQKNKNWSGTGFFIKGTQLELSPLCFASQSVMLGSGKYRAKIIGSSISGNGIFSIQFILNDKEIFSKKISLSGKNNTEISFDLDLENSGSYSVKICRGKESIGRVSISLLNIVKVIEKTNVEIIKLNQEILNKKEKTFFIINYDLLNNNKFFNLISPIKNKSEIFFLLKTSDSFISKENNLNFKLFFEWEDLFDYMDICNSKKIIYLESNLNKSIFSKYNYNIGIVNPIRLGKRVTNKISGIIF
jgi:hypothetical protein